MNDFTKEELQSIFHNLREVREWSDDLVGAWPLLDKIQSMIDNYCEHNWHPGGNRPWLHCIKCKANFHHEGYG